MTDDQFRNVCNIYGFAPSRALRELVEMVISQAVISEREGCARVCENIGDYDENVDEYYSDIYAAAIRAPDKKRTPPSVNLAGCNIEGGDAG
jgi:hypothetical protein